MTNPLGRLTVMMVAMVLAGAHPTRARACSAPVVGPRYALDPAERGVDVQAPDPPEIGAIQVGEPVSTGDGCSPCGSGVLRWVRIPVTARDDRTPASRMGYRIMRDANAPVFGTVGDVQA